MDCSVMASTFPSSRPALLLGAMWIKAFHPLPLQYGPAPSRTSCLRNKSQVNIGFQNAPYVSGLPIMMRMSMPDLDPAVIRGRQVACRRSFGNGSNSLHSCTFVLRGLEVKTDKEMVLRPETGALCHHTQPTDAVLHRRKPAAERRPATAAVHVGSKAGPSGTSREMSSESATHQALEEKVREVHRSQSARMQFRGRGSIPVWWGDANTHLL